MKQNTSIKILLFLVYQVPVVFVHKVFAPELVFQQVLPHQVLEWGTTLATSTNHHLYEIL